MEVPRRQSGSWAGIGGVPADRRYTAIKERPRAWAGTPLFVDDDIELFVVITAYKECAAQIDVSLQGVQQGIKVCVPCVLSPAPARAILAPPCLQQLVL